MQPAKTVFMFPERDGWYPEYQDAVVERYLLDGKLHREDGPAHVRLNRDGKKISEAWLFLGELHREGGPASLEYFKDGTRIEGSWRHGKLHGKSARYGPTGELEVEIYYENHVMHRTDGPAQIEYKEGNYTEHWFSYGIPHRMNGPAYTNRWSGFRTTGCNVRYYLHGILMNLDRYTYYSGLLLNSMEAVVTLAHDFKKYDEVAASLGPTYPSLVKSLKAAGQLI